MKFIVRGEFQVNEKNRRLFTIVGVMAVSLIVIGISVSMPDESGQPSRTDPAAAPMDVTTEDMSQPPEGETTTPTVEVPDVSALENTSTQGQADPVLDVEQEDQVGIDLIDSERKLEAAPPLTPSPEEQQAANEDDEPIVSDPAADQPQSGDTQDGSIYIEGFGWTPNEGGSSVQHNIDSDGDINKQVGIMGRPLTQECGISAVLFLHFFSKINRPGVCF